MELSELREWVFRDLSEATSGNARVAAQTLTDTINRAYVWVASTAKCFVREAHIHAVNGQEVYDLQPDMHEIVSVRYSTAADNVALTAGTTPLTPTTRRELSAYIPSFRDSTAGTPTRYYIHDMSRRFGLYPAPSTTSARIVTEAYVVPVSATTALRELTFTSGGITEITVGATVTNNGATATVYEVHLRTGTWAGGDAAGHIYIDGQNGSFAAGALLIGVDDVATIAGNSTVLTDTRLYLLVDADEPELPEAFQPILVHDSVARLCSRFLNDGDATVMQKMQAALADRDQLVAQLLEYEATGVGRPVSAGSQATRR